MIKRTQTRYLLAICATLLAIGSVGCSKEQGTVQVSGRVLIDGQPLTYGIVRFLPEGGRQSGGEIGSDGSFSLSTYKSGDGVALGAYRIAVIAKEPLSGSRFRWHAPKSYANAATSELFRTVEGPADDVLIELSWGSKKGPFEERM